MSKQKKNTLNEIGDDITSVGKILVIGGVAFVAYELVTSGVLKDLLTTGQGVAGVVDTIAGSANKLFGFDRTDPCEKPKWYTWLSGFGTIKNLSDRSKCAQQKEDDSVNTATDILNTDTTPGDADKEKEEVGEEDQTTNIDTETVGAALRVAWAKYQVTGEEEYLQQISELASTLTDQDRAVLMNDPVYKEILQFVVLRAIRGIESVGEIGTQISSPQGRDADNARGGREISGSVLSDMKGVFNMESF